MSNVQLDEFYTAVAQAIRNTLKQEQLPAVGGNVFYTHPENDACHCVVGHVAALWQPEKWSLNEGVGLCFLNERAVDSRHETPPLTPVQWHILDKLQGLHDDAITYATEIDVASERTLADDELQAFRAMFRFTLRAWQQTTCNVEVDQMLSAALEE